MDTIQLLDSSQCETLSGGKYWGSMTSIKAIELGAVFNIVDQSNQVTNTAGGMNGWGYGKFGSKGLSSIINSQANIAELVTVAL